MFRCLISMLKILPGRLLCAFANSEVTDFAASGQGESCDEPFR